MTVILEAYLKKRDDKESTTVMYFKCNVIWYFENNCKYMHTLTLFNAPIMAVNILFFIPHAVLNLGKPHKRRVELGIFPRGENYKTLKGAFLKG